ncbi:MAG: PilN domain-containing protein [Nitrospinales bacterium]
MKPFYLDKSLGLDIREESVAITLLGKQLRSIHTLGSRFFKIQPLRGNDESAEKAEKFFLEEINRFLMRYPHAPNNVILSLPRNLITFKTFDLPAPDRKSIDAMIKFELEKHCAVSVDSLYFSYLATEKAKNQFHIVLSAVKREVADYYLDLIKKIDLKPSIMDVSTFSNLNLIQSNGGVKERIATVIDLGSTGMDISILKEGVIETSRNVPIQDAEFLASYFRDDYPPEHFKKSSEKLGRIIIDEIQTCLSSCNSIAPDEPVEKIYLFGGGYYAEPLAEYLEQQTGVTAKTVAPPYDKNQTISPNFVPSLMGTSLSLGLRKLRSNWAEINILPRTLRPKKSKFNLKTTLAFSVIVALLLVGLLVVKIVHNNLTLNNLKDQLKEARSQVVGLEKIDLEYDALMQFVDLFANIDKQSPPKLPVLQELSTIIPKDTWLTDISFSKDKMEIKGLSASASKLIPILESSPYFKDTAFNGSIVTQGNGEKFTIRSTVEARQ